MNKNRIFTLTLALALATASTTVYADTTTTTDSTTAATARQKPAIDESAIMLDLSSDNKANLLSDLGLTEEEFTALELDKNGKDGERMELTDEESTAKLEEKAAELGVTVDELKTQMSEKGAKTETTERAAKAELTDEERTAKMEEKAAELGITVDELKAQISEKGERPAKPEGENGEITDDSIKTERNHDMLRLSETDVQTLATATGMTVAKVTAILNNYIATK